MTQGDFHSMARAARGIGPAYKIEDGQRVYVRRRGRGFARAERYEVTVFPAAGGRITARGVGGSEAEARANVRTIERDT